MSGALAALPCICGKHMVERANEGTCLWCGHGMARPVIEHAYRRNMEGNLVSAVHTTPRFDARVVPLRRAPSHIWDQDACAISALKFQNATGRFPSSTEWQRARASGEHRPTYATIRSLFGGWPAFKEYCADIPREQVA